MSAAIEDAPLWLAGGMRFDPDTSAALDDALASAATSSTRVSSDSSLHATWSSTYEHPEAEAYDAMVEHEERASKYEAAIRQRLARQERELVVLDIGTGPFALLALIAARAGAKRVYAIEASPWAARLARACVERACDVPSGVVSVIEGLSTDVTLPEKADLLVAELVGSVASDEGLVATMRDTVERLVKRPNDPASYIPVRCQTMCAPAAYALHYLLTPPRFDWADGLNGQAVRTPCWDTAVQPLCAPQMLEDIAFHEPLPPPRPSQHIAEASTPQARSTLEFTVSTARTAHASACYLATLRRERLSEASASPLAAAMARTLSGLACWPRLELDVDGEIVIESRGPNGEAVHRSEHATHWQTVLPLLAPRPLTVAPGDTVRLTVDVQSSLRVEEPTRYELMGEVVRTLEAPVVLRRHAAKARGDDHDEHIHTSMEAEADGMEYALVVEPRAVMITGEALGP